MADVLLVLPIVMYAVIPDTQSFAKYHQTYINMLAAAYGPIGIIWWIVLANDSRIAREALTGAVEMAGLGPFALCWVGYFSFLMSAQSSGSFSTNAMLWMWSILYFILNVGLVVAHWYLSPLVYAWVATAELPDEERAFDATAKEAKEMNDAADVGTIAGSGF